MPAALAGLQCGFGAPLGASVLAELKALALSVIRLDLQDVDDATTTALAQEVLDAGLRPLCIIRRPDQMLVLPDTARIEVGNEPDLEHFGWTPESYVAVANDCVEIARATLHTLYVGAVSNLNDRGFDFLKTLPWADYPPSIRCSVHRYPETGSATAPHFPPSRTRDDEVRTLRNLVGRHLEAGRLHLPVTHPHALGPPRRRRRCRARQTVTVDAGRRLPTGFAPPPRLQQRAVGHGAQMRRHVVTAVTQEHPATPSRRPPARANAQSFSGRSAAVSLSYTTTSPAVNDGIVAGSASRVAASAASSPQVQARRS
jgi:hypothetical protein